MNHLTSKINQRLGLLRRIKHLPPFKARLLFYNGLVIGLFENHVNENVSWLNITIIISMIDRKNTVSLHNIIT